MPHISVLTSLYCMEAHIQEFYDRSLKAIQAITDDYEFVFVDDGSPDDSKAIVLSIIKKDNRVRLIELSRNYGQHKAIMASLPHLRGDYVFLLDTDLEEKPELLGPFYERMQENPGEIDVVYGYTEKRKGGPFEKFSGAVFYRLFNALSDVKIQPNLIAARLMTRDYVQHLAQFDEAHIFLSGLMELTGFKQVGLPVTKSSRGVTTYTLRRKVTLATDAILSFTNRPLAFVALLGAALTTASVLAALCLIARQWTTGTPAEGWTIVLVTLWILGGLTISSIGLVGVYIGRVFIQVKRRPNAIIKKIHN